LKSPLRGYSSGCGNAGATKTLTLHDGLARFVVARHRGSNDLGVVVSVLSRTGSRPVLWSSPLPEVLVRHVGHARHTHLQ